MRESLKTAFWVFLYSLAAGFSLFLFTQIGQIYKYAFSLLAIYIGIRFFRRFESIGLRIAFIALAVVLYFLAAIIFALYWYVKENPDLFLSPA